MNEGDIYVAANGEEFGHVVVGDTDGNVITQPFTSNGFHGAPNYVIAKLRLTKIRFQNATSNPPEWVPADVLELSESFQYMRTYTKLGDDGASCVKGENENGREGPK